MSFRLIRGQVHAVVRRGIERDHSTINNPKWKNSNDQGQFTFRLGSGASPLFHCFTRCATWYHNSPPSARSTEGWAKLGIQIPRSIDSSPLSVRSVVSFSTLADRTRNRHLADRQPASRYRDIRAFAPPDILTSAPLCGDVAFARNQNCSTSPQGHGQIDSSTLPSRTCCSRRGRSPGLHSLATCATR